MRLGIYGGTFNPIHRGHIHILGEFITRLYLDKVLLIPTRVPPHKQAGDLAGEEDRINMCRLAAAGIEGVPVEVSNIEMEREGKSYTADTLRQIHQLYPEARLFLLMGEDMFLTIDSWYAPQEITKLAALCASPRSGDGYEKLLAKGAELEKKLSATCLVEDIPYLPVSSTEIRELAQKGLPLGPLVPSQVEDYIRDHGIYRGERANDI